MVAAWQAVAHSLRDLWDEFVFLLVLNVLWSLTALLPTLPFAVLKNMGFWWALSLTTLLSLPLPIVSGALCWVTNQIARGRAVGWDTFVVGLRRYWHKSLAVALINVAVVIVILVNVRFYNTILQGTCIGVAFLAWAVVAAYWLLAQVFWFPMILELESEGVLLALRNALGLVIVTPGFTLGLAILLLVLLVLCALMPLSIAFVAVSLFLLIANHATRSRLAWAQKKPYEPQKGIG